MEHTIVEGPAPHERQEGSELVPATEILKSLSAILQSTPFHSSKQSQELLQYIVNQTLAGHLEMLKERIIGANVFNRRPDYDTNDDPIVRARAAEVRKRLALYYQTAREETVWIGIPSGSFRATFEWAERNPPAQSQPVPQPSPEDNHPLAEPVTHATLIQVARTEHSPSSGRFPIRSWWVVTAAVVILLIWATQHYF